MTSGGQINYIAWQKSCHYHYHHYTRPNRPKYLTFFVTIYTCEYLNRRELKNISVTIYRRKNRRVFILLWSKTVNFQKPDMSRLNFHYLKAFWSKTKINLWKRRDSKRPQNKIPPESGTEMVSLQFYWLNKCFWNYLGW